MTRDITKFINSIKDSYMSEAAKAQTEKLLPVGTIITVHSQRGNEGHDERWIVYAYEQINSPFAKTTQGKWLCMVEEYDEVWGKPLRFSLFLATTADFQGRIEDMQAVNMLHGRKVVTIPVFTVTIEDEDYRDFNGKIVGKTPDAAGEAE